jgi:hypothetical protein
MDARSVHSGGTWRQHRRVAHVDPGLQPTRPAGRAGRARRGDLLGSLLWLLATVALSAPADGAYDQLIHTTAQRAGLEPALIKAVIQCESQFNPRAQSPRGAQGLMQLMPATQTLLGVRDGFDPQDNVEAGVYYLARLTHTFQGDLRLSLAAYNAGPQAVVNAGYRVPPIAETQRYVQCVLAAQDAYRHLGLRVPFPSMRAGPGQAEPRGPLVVSPLRLSAPRARPGELITVHLEARNTSPQGVYGAVMLYYPAHLVSGVALYTDGGETAVHWPAAPVGQAAPVDATAAEQFLRSAWPTWQPGEQHRIMIALRPGVPQDLMLYLSVLLEPSAQTARPQRWGSAVRIPVQGSPVESPPAPRPRAPR